MTLATMRRALRLLAENLILAIATTVSLAFGLAAALIGVLVLDRAWLHPLAYPSAERLVVISEASAKLPSYGLLPVRPGVFTDLREKLTSYESIGGFAVSSPTLTEAGPPAEIDVVRMSAGLLEALRVGPLLGRAFGRTDEQESNGLVALISEDMWTTRFGRDPQVIGKTIALSGRRYGVVGVMPATFTFPRRHELPNRLRLSERGRADVWVPLVLSAAAKRSTGNWTLGVVARLKSGVALAQANEELHTTCVALRSERQDMYADATCSGHLLLADVRARSWGATQVVLFAGGLLLLLMASLNVSCATLAGMVRRSTEFGIRVAIGATRRHLLEHLMAEHLVLGGLAAILAAGLAMLLIALVIGFAPAALPRLNELTFDVRAASVLVGLDIVVIFALVWVSYVALTSCRRHGTRFFGDYAVSSRNSRAMSGILLAQTALSLALVIGLALMITTFVRLSSVDKGMDPRDLFLVRLSVDREAYRTPADWPRFYANVTDQLISQGGVASVAIIDTVPFSGDSDISDTVSGDHPNRAPIQVEFRRASEPYFATVGIPLLKGRGFTATDAPGTLPVAVVNSRLAQQLWPGVDPIGKTLKRENDTWRTVVGVVGNVRQARLDREARPQAYIPFAQGPWSSATVLVKAQGAHSADLQARIRAAIRDAAPQQPIGPIETMDDHIEATLADRRFALRLFTVLGVAAVVLMSTGIFGVTFYTVRTRLRETAIRVALGATPAKLQADMLLAAGRLLCAGLGVGLLFGRLISFEIRALLFDTEGAQLVLYVLATASLMGVGLLSFYLPVRRATRSDPTRLLKSAD